MNTQNTQNTQSKMMENWGECMSRKMSEIADLNLRTLNKITNRTDLFEELMEARRPQDFITAQVRLATMAGSEAVRYSQEIYHILWDDMSQQAQEFSESFQEGGENMEKESDRSSRSSGRNSSNREGMEESSQHHASSSRSHSGKSSSSSRNK